MKSLDPFSFFRRNQGMFLAVFGVLILVIFTVGPSIQSYQSGGGTGGNAVVAQWNQWSVSYISKIPLLGRWFQGAETVTENELIQLRQLHIRLHYVLDDIRPATISVNPTVAPLRYDTGDQYLIDLRLVENKAKELGIVVTDQMIDDYLIAFSNSEITIEHSKFLNRLEGDLRRALHKKTDGQMTELQFYDQLRRELTFQYMFNRFGASGASDIISPTDLWTYHQQNYRQIEIELLEFDAGSYLKDVTATPSLTDSQQYYNKYRETEQDPFPFNPRHSYPGFRYPEQIDFAYLHLHYQEDYYEPELQTAKAAITDKQVKQYYEEHKLNYIKEPEPEEKPADDKKDDKDKPADDKKDDKDKPADDKKDDKEKPADDPVPLIEYRPLKEVREEILNKMAQQQAGPIAKDKFRGAIIQLQRISQFLKFQGGQLDDLAATKKDLLKKADKKDIKKLTDPIDKEMKDKIADLKSNVKDLSAKFKMRSGQTGTITSQDVRDWNEKEATETDPDYVALLRAQEIRISGRSNSQRVSFAQLAFRENVPIYEPSEIQEPFRITGDNRSPSVFNPTPEHAFLFWRLDITKSHTPKWKDIKEDVEKSWQVRKAGDLAYQAAETVAAKVNKSNQTLAEALPDLEKEIKNPEKFAMGNFPFNTFMLNEESIEKMFSIKSGATVALRSAKFFPETSDFKIANSTYLVRIISTEPSEMQLRQEFLTSLSRFRNNAPVDRRERFEIGNGWLEDLHSEVELVWIRAAQTRER